MGFGWTDDRTASTAALRMAIAMPIPSSAGRPTPEVDSSGMAWPKLMSAALAEPMSAGRRQFGAVARAEDLVDLLVDRGVPASVVEIQNQDFAAEHEAPQAPDTQRAQDDGELDRHSGTSNDFGIVSGMRQGRDPELATRKQCPDLAKIHSSA
jgi:hypothetical protein